MDFDVLENINFLSAAIAVGVLWLLDLQIKHTKELKKKIEHVAYLLDQKDPVFEMEAENRLIDIQKQLDDVEQEIKLIRTQKG